MFQKAEMKQFAKSDTSVLKQHYEKKLNELEQEKKALQVSLAYYFTYIMLFFTDTLVTLFLFTERNREPSPCINQYIFVYGWECSKTERKLSSEAERTWISGLYFSWIACSILHILTAQHLQVSELKKKQEAQQQLLRQKQRSDEAAKRLQEDIQRIKSQKVFFPPNFPKRN